MRKTLAAVLAVAVLVSGNAAAAAVRPAPRRTAVTPAPATATAAASQRAPTGPGPARLDSAQAPAALGNPVTGSQGFNVFVQGNATFNATAVQGPVALGGNLAFGSGTFGVATTTAGSFTASGDSRPTGLLVGGNVNWSGTSSTGTLSVQNNSYVKIGDMTGSAVAQSGSAPTHIVRAGHSYSSLPQIAETVTQPTVSVNQSGLINFSSAFSSFTAQSATLAACAANVVLTNASGTPLTLPLAPGTNAYITLTPSTTNILNITAANLANISTLTFRNSPASTRPFVINVDTSGVGGSFSWSVKNINGFSDSGAPYLLWNFSGTSALTVTGSQTVPGTIYAPAATVTENDSNGVNGGVIAAAYSQGGSGGSPSGGQVLAAPFAGSLGSCTSAAALSIAQTASPATAVPGGTVSYTITATNSGSVAYTGATLTDALAGVLDDATYNNNASATAGTVSFSSPSLTWTGNLAAGATATLTVSVTVRNPDTGDKTLSATITSTTTGSNCASGSTDPSCRSSVPVAVLAIAATASTPTTTPGSTVSYTITVTNSGGSAYTGATFTDGLAGVLDDATYNNNASATAGTVSFSSPSLTWTGNLATGATATITFSVTVRNPDTGDKTLSTLITSSTAGSNCASGSTDPGCATSVTVLVPGLTLSVAASSGSTTPGATVQYTVTATNTGQTTYTGISFVTQVDTDDATYNNDAAATAGSVSFSSPNVTWTGNLAPGATVTVTYSETVLNPVPVTGDKVLVTTLSSAVPGNNCLAGSADPRCVSTVPILVPGLTISQSAGAGSTTPGGTVHYTITVTNSGQTTAAGATFTDPLGDVLDDASYNADASATAGSVSFSSPSLTWTGNLAVGASATITFSVTVRSPDTGNHILASTITSTTAGSNCAAGSGAAACTSSVPVAELAIVNSAGVSSTTPGSVVRFTSTFSNTGQVAYTGITVTIPISDINDDATGNGDQTATSGTLSITATTLSWTGSIPVGGTVTVTGTVTVNNPDLGNKVLASTLQTAAPGSNCPPGGTDPACSVSVPVLIPALTLSQSASTTAAVPGQTVTYTVTATDSGPTAYTGLTVTETLLNLDDASYNNDAVATSGPVSYASPVLTWTGNLAVGATVTITFTMTVHDPDTGDKIMETAVASTAAGSNCPPGSGNTGCTLSFPVLTPGLTIVSTAGTPNATPGQRVTFTVTVTNSGQTPYTGATFTDPLASIVDDADYNGDAAATSGTVGVAGTTLTWTGDLAVGATSTITFSATVHNPDTGDVQLTSTVTSPTAGSNCAAGSTDPRCTVTVALVGVQTLTFTQTTGAASATAGGVVNYTITVANSGASPFAGATFTDPLGDVLDDASYNSDASTTAGTVSFSSPNLTWTGTVPASGSVTITFSVTVHDPDTGNQILSSTLSSASPDSNCPAGSTDPRCAAVVTVSGLAIVNSASVSSTTPGSVVRFTATFRNTGQTPYLGITIASNITDVLDDATPNGDQTATSGTLELTSTGISWTGDIPVGGTVTVTGTVTVDNPDLGNKVLASILQTAAPGSNCPPGGTDPACSVSVPVLIPGLTLSQSASTTAAVPGQTVSYTVTVANTGQTPYSAATVTDTLRNLDDAVYNSDAVATSGTVSYASPVLTWTGSLAVGATVTITFTMTVNDPDTGDKTMTTTVASSDPGSSCPPASPNPGCTLTFPVLTPALVITSTAGAASAPPGGTVHYTITVANTGQTSYTGISVTDGLAGVLDDASYNSDASATAGTVSFSSPSLTWTGNLAVGATATITFSVTVRDPNPGNGVLASTVTSAAAGNNCPAGSTDPRCATTVDVSALTIVNSASTSTTAPGATVDYTVTVTDTGQTPYTAATVTDPLTGLLASADYNFDGTATAGSVQYQSPDLVWTGSLSPGDTATITFSVTVHDSLAAAGQTLTSTVTSGATGNNCPAGSTDPRCTATVTVLTPALAITKTASASSTTPGGVVGYTIIVSNTGQTAYAGATVTDPLGGVLTDASYNRDAAATGGSVSFASPVLTWTGNLNPGQAVVITYSVTVNNPDTGDHVMVNTAATPVIGSNCPAGSTDPRCTATVTVLTPGLTITKTASASTATPGTTVGYTITVADTGQTSYTGATVRDSLGGVLNDASYNADAAATIGSVSYTTPVLTWTGSLAPGQTATITYSVTVTNPDTGGRVLTNSAVSSEPGSNCPAGSTDPRCTATVSVLPGQLSITVPVSAFLGSTTPGGTVSAGLGPVQVTDNRGFGADWTVTVSATNFTTGTATPAETISVRNASYDITGLQTTGPAVFRSQPVTVLNTTPQAVVSATSVAGNTSASWDPQIVVSVPGTAVGGQYTTVITHSVS